MTWQYIHHMSQPGPMLSCRAQPWQSLASDLAARASRRAIAAPALPLVRCQWVEMAPLTEDSKAQFRLAEAAGENNRPLLHDSLKGPRHSQ